MKKKQRKETTPETMKVRFLTSVEGHDFSYKINDIDSLPIDIAKRCIEHDICEVVK